MTTPTTPSIFEPDAPRMMLFGGKGGVGKTTLACATALHHALADPDRQTILVSTDPAHSTSDALGSLELPANLTLHEMDADEAHREFLEANIDRLREIAARGTFLDEDDIDGLLELSLPGVDELMSFLTLADLLHDNPDARFVIDTAPTGHTLRLLGIPHLLGSWLEAIDTLLAKHRYMASVFSSGKEDEVDEFLERFTDRASELSELLEDGDECRFVPVCLAEPMSIAETTRMIEELDELDIPSEHVVINRLIPAGSSPELANWRSRQLEAISNAPESFDIETCFALPLMEKEPREQTLQETPGRMRPLNTLLAIETDLTPLGPNSLPVGSISPGVRTAELITLAGKGGVGKTTMSCSIAAGLAAEGNGRILLVSTDPAGSLGDCFNRQIGSDPTPITPNLSALQLDADAEFEGLKQDYLDELESLTEAFGGGDIQVAFEQEAMEKLIDLAPPGLDEVMALTRLCDLLAEGTWSTIVLDTAPTGHLLRLLELPELARQWIGRMLRLLMKYEDMLSLPKLQERLAELSVGIKNLGELLRDGERTSLIPVSVPTALAAAETDRLILACDDLGVRIPTVILNQIVPGDTHPTLASRSGISVVTVPLSGDPRGIDHLQALGTSLFAGDAGANRQAA